MAPDAVSLPKRIAFCLKIVTDNYFLKKKIRSLAKRSKRTKVLLSVRGYCYPNPAMASFKWLPLQNIAGYNIKKVLCSKQFLSLGSRV